MCTICTTTRSRILQVSRGKSNHWKVLPLIIYQKGKNVYVRKYLRSLDRKNDWRSSFLHLSRPQAPTLCVLHNKCLGAMGPSNNQNVDSTPGSCTSNYATRGKSLSTVICRMGEKEHKCYLPLDTKQKGERAHMKAFYTEALYIYKLFSLVCSFALHEF